MQTDASATRDGGEPRAAGTRARLLAVASWPRLPLVALAAILASYGLLKLYSLNFVNGDEHMYYAMSLLVARGRWPYRDFFFSHPPLQLYIAGAFYKLFGYSLALSKAIPSLAAVVSGVHVYRIGRRLVGAWEGVLGTALFLFSFDVLRGSSHFTGANCALAFGLAATYQALRARQVLAGILFAVGTFIGIYIAPLALMLVVLLGFRAWKESLRLLASYAATSAAIVALFAGVAGLHAFWYQIFSYNLHKVAFHHSWYAKFRNVAFLNSAAMIGFLPGALWAASLWRLRGRARGESVLPGVLGRIGSRLNLWNGDGVAAQMLFAIFIGGYFYFYSTRVDYYSYYFMLIMPWMGLMTATWAIDVGRFLRGLRRPAPLPPPDPSRGKKSRKGKRVHETARSQPRVLWPLGVTVVALLAVLLYRQSIAGDRQAEMGEEGSRYTWRDSAYLPAWVNAAVKAVFWQPSSDPVHPPNAVTYYLQHESMHAATIETFVAMVRAECRPGERIFGDYSLGPFAAALGPCVLAANLADTNPHRLRVHESTAEDWVRALEADHLDIAILASDAVMLKEPALRSYLTSTFPHTVAVWNDPYVGHVELRRRAAEPERGR